MYREDLTQYDIRPKYMDNYLRYTGPHFNKDLHDFAVSMMKKKVAGRTISIQPYSKEEVDKLLATHGVKLENKATNYDYVYVANMCKADFLGSSVPDEKHLAHYVKDVIDDVDGYNGLVFNRWYADMCKKGISIDWANVV